MVVQNLKLKSATLAECQHPWVRLEDVEAIEGAIENGSTCRLLDSDGVFLGTGIIDQAGSDPVWRRFSFAEDAAFNADYISTAMGEALGRRGDEACQRLVSSDADFLPGLTVELWSDVAVVIVETEAVRLHIDAIVELLREAFQLVEVVIIDGDQRRTLSGNNLKARWAEIGDLKYRIDFLNPLKPRFPLELREQHLLFGSLCEGRRVLDIHALSGGFGMQAMAHGALSAHALEPNGDFSKAIGANAQRNGLTVATASIGVSEFFETSGASLFDAIVLNPGAWQQSDFCELHCLAFNALPSGGVLATYRDQPTKWENSLEACLREAASSAGREARLFAKTSQPFDFPTLLNFPESQVVEGVLLEVL